MNVNKITQKQLDDLICAARMAYYDLCSANDYLEAGGCQEIGHPAFQITPKALKKILTEIGYEPTHDSGFPPDNLSKV